MTTPVSEALVGSAPIARGSPTAGDDPLWFATRSSIRSLSDRSLTRQLLAAMLLDATLDELRQYVERWPERMMIPLKAALTLTNHLG